MVFGSLPATIRGFGRKIALGLEKYLSYFNLSREKIGERIVSTIKTDT